MGTEIIITLITLGAGFIGWNVNTLITLHSRSRDDAGAIKVLTETQKDIRDLLNLVIARQDKADETMGDIRDDLNSLKGEHAMMLRAGSIVSQHEKKS